MLPFLSDSMKTRLKGDADERDFQRRLQNPIRSRGKASNDIREIARRLLLLSSGSFSKKVSASSRKERNGSFIRIKENKA